MKNFDKIFTKPKQRAALRKLFSLPPTNPPPNKILLRLWNKNFLTDIYRNIQTFAFKVLQECSSWASRNGAVQLFFLTPNRNMFAGKFVKSERFLAVFRGGSRAAAASKMERFVIIVNGWKLLSIITKRSILDVAAVLDPPLVLREHIIFYAK